MSKFVTICVCFLLLFACKKKSINCGLACTYDEELIFQTGFENTSLNQGEHSNANFSGTDLTFSEKNNWAAFSDHPNIGRVEINYEDGDNNQRLASIVQDPEAPENHVLRFGIVEPHIKEGTKKKGRVQLEVAQNQCIREIYQTVRLRFHPDMAELMQWNERVYWLSIFEFWNNADWSKEKYPFRVTVNLFKDQEGVVDAMYFHVKGDQKKNCKNCKWKDVWEAEANHFPIPFGQWMNVKLYLKEGDENNGRFYMSVQPDGEEETVLFNITNFTQHPKEKCPDGFTHMQPLKFYTSDKLIEFMQERNKKLEIFWDDWKFYRNKTF